MRREFLIFVLFVLIIGSVIGVAAQSPITKNQLQAAFSQGYAAGVQSQQSYIQEMQSEIDRLTAENKSLKEK